MVLMVLTKKFLMKELMGNQLAGYKLRQRICFDCVSKERKKQQRFPLDRSDAIAAGLVLGDL